MQLYMKEEWDISFCGLNCAQCSLYLIPESIEAAQQVLSWFQSEGWTPQDITPQKFMESNGRECEGCRGTENKCWSPTCNFRRCANSKGIDYCFQCSQFPCAEISAFENDGSRHHAQTIENLKRMQDMGVETFKKQFKSPEFCPSLH